MKIYIKNLSQFSLRNFFDASKSKKKKSEETQSIHMMNRFILAFIHINIEHIRINLIGSRMSNGCVCL